ncbi:MAG: type II toxin-antitoxin system RelE/ParE family toxin [Christensenellales bacterium]|jgi:toxin ParE1/3/4
MKNKLHYTAGALRDLDEIWDNIMLDLSNPTTTMNVVNSIMAAIDRLLDFPGAGAPLSSVTNGENDYRFLVTGNYLAFYRVVASDIYIDRILYGRRDFMRVLFEDVQGET